MIDGAPEGPFQQRLRLLVDDAVAQPHPSGEQLGACLEQVRACDPGDETDVIFAFLEVHRLASHVRRGAGREATEPLFATVAELALDAYARLGRPQLVAGLARQLWSMGMGQLSLALLEQAESLAVEPSEPSEPDEPDEPDEPIEDDSSPPAALLVNLRGELLRLVGELDAAEVCFAAALAQLEAASGGHDADRAVVLNNLGTVYREKGDLTRAKDHLIRSLDLCVQAGGSGLAVAVTLDNLGCVEVDLAVRNGPLWIDGGPEGHLVNATAERHLTEADGHFDRARELFEDELPEAADDYVACLINAARVTHQWRDMDKLDALSERALDLARAHPVDVDTRWLVVDLRGGALLETGRAHEAVALMAGAYEQLWPNMVPHERLPEGLTTLLRAAMAAGEETIVEGTARTIASIDDRLLGRLLVAGSDAEARHRFRRYAARTELVLGYCLLAGEGTVAEWLVELVLNRKGVLAERQGAAWLRDLDPDDARSGLVDEVRRLRAEAARLDLDGTDSDAISHARRRHEEAERRVGEAEARLHRELAADRPPIPQVTVGDVQARLDPDTLLLEFATMRRPDDTTRYVVFFIAGNGPVRYRDLGPVDAVGRTEPWDHRGLAPLPIFTPDDELPGRVIVAPTGGWGLVPFGLLPAPDGRPLIEDHLVTVVPAARWLALSPPATGATGPAVVLGDPDFDLEFADQVSFFLKTRYSRLAGTAEEARDVAARLGVEPVLDAAATRRRLLGARRPRVLHIATHGVFVDAIANLAERREPRSYTSRNVGGAVVTEENEGGALGWPLPSRRPASGDARELHRRRVQWLEKIGPADPLSRSVIMMAGANAWLAGVDTPAEVGTGMVSAGEFALLDLTGTELVVLSACETGAGAVDYADGSLLGLRTAALRAGAACCVSTLWKVEDETAAALMAAFYRRIDDGDRPGAALRAAQLEIRATHPDPYHWAGWVAEGATA